MRKADTRCVSAFLILWLQEKIRLYVQRFCDIAQSIHRNPNNCPLNFADVTLVLIQEITQLILAHIIFVAIVNDI